MTTSRREFLAANAMGMGPVALSWLLQQDMANAKPKNLPKGTTTFDLKPKPPHHTPRAKSMISLFQHGGPSHMDLTDPKPVLIKMDGTDYSGNVGYSFVNEASKKLMSSRWKFAKHGQCGTELSELLPHTAEIVDDICLIRSMHNHSNLGTSLPSICRRKDKPSAALVKDLNQRGLLDEVIVHWGGEIG